MSTFSEYGHVAYLIKWNPGCSNMVEKYIPCRLSDPLPLALGVGQKIKIQVLEHGYVAYQIKGKDACSNMAANICTRRPL